MDLIPDEEIQSKSFLNLTPMVDFLFLVIAIFSILAVTKTSVFDSTIDLAKVADADHAPSEATEANIHLSIPQSGGYRWITEFNEYAMQNTSTILTELSTQRNLGLLPQEPSKINIFLHIDKGATWDPIVELIYSLKKANYQVHPVYEESR